MVFFYHCTVESGLVGDPTRQRLTCPVAEDQDLMPGSTKAHPEPQEICYSVGLQTYNAAQAEFIDRS